MKKNDDIFKYGRNIEWSLPVMFSAESVWTTMYKQIKYYNNSPPKVNAYGCPACNWTGGRLPSQESINFKTLDKIFNYMHDCNASPTLTFTYTGFTKDDLKDWYSNAILDFALEHKSKFIVYSDLLRDYIKNKSSDAHIIASVIKSSVRFQGVNRIEDPTPENETNYYNKLLKEYDMVVVRPEYSRFVLIEHPEYIDDISRIEVLINQTCVPNCPLACDHYKTFEKYRFGNQPEGSIFECIRTKLSKDDSDKASLLHSYSEISKLVKSGVKHLKLQGRGDRTSLEHLLFLFYTQMFNSDGNAYRVIFDFPQVLNQEFNYIKQLTRE